MDLNELIDRTHFDYEQNETKAKGFLSINLPYKWQVNYV